MIRDSYLVAGHDLRAFTADWVSNLESGGGQMRGLLDHVHGGPAGERYSYGGHYMMGNIGARANAPDVAVEELLLWAVLAVYQMADWPGSARWKGEEPHVARAFAYFHEIGGEREAARRLRVHVLQQATQSPEPVLDELLNRSLGDDPGRIAEHERLMASIDARSFAAGAVLDPHADFDDELRALTS